MIKFRFVMQSVSVNKMYVNLFHQKRRFLSSEAKKAKEFIISEVRSTLLETDPKIISSLERKNLVFKIEIVSPSWMLKDGVTPRKKDASNCIKLVEDAVFTGLNEVIETDDKYIFELSVVKTYHQIDEYIDVTIYEK